MGGSWGGGKVGFVALVGASWGGVIAGSASWLVAVNWGGRCVGHVLQQKRLMCVWNVLRWRGLHGC